MLRIDTHHHLWDQSQRPQTWMTPELDAVIGGPFDMADWAVAAAPAGITHGVFVQTVPQPEETPEVLALSETNEALAGVVGWIDIASPTAAGDLLAAQVAATRPLYTAVESGELDVDLVLWPEGSSDWDPTRDEFTARVWNDVSRQMDAPLLAQAVTTDGERYFNTAILWDAQRSVTDRVVDTYDKRHPVPMGEYVPDRAFWEPFAPDLIGLIQREYTPGTTDAVMDIGGVIAGVNICFDIVDDALMRESVLDGGRVILPTSNNADFGYTDESAQQLAFARIRAIELGRSVVNVSTVGISAIIVSDGSITASLPWYEPGTIIADVPLADTITPATSGGASLEIAIGAMGLAMLAAAGVLTVIDRRAQHRADRGSAT